MARPIKDGVDYFPKDTDFYGDDKVRLLRGEFGAKGMYILDYLLCDLYGKNGYFIKWDKNKCFLVSDGAGCGCTPEFIAEFIAGCVRCSFFNERVFDLFGILTSAGIQRRYIRMFNSRDEIQFYKEYWLLDLENKKDVPAGILNKLVFKTLTSTENPDKSTGNPNKNTDNSQSKIKENKEEKNNTPISPKNIFKLYAGEDKKLLKTLVDFEQMRKFIKKPLSDRAKELLLAKLDKLANTNNEKIAILEQSIMNNWQGVFALKDKEEGVMREQDTGHNQHSFANRHFGDVL